MHVGSFFFWSQVGVATLLILVASVAFGAGSWHFRAFLDPSAPSRVGTGRVWLGFEISGLEVFGASEFGL